MCWGLFSSSSKQLHRGSAQLKLWWNLCERKSENSTRNFDKRLTPRISFIQKTDFLRGWMNNNNLFLNWLTVGKTYVNVCMLISVCVCLYVNVCMLCLYVYVLYVYACILMYVCIYVNACMCIYVCLYLYVYVCICMSVC